jgi:hypothetical protein
MQGLFLLGTSHPRDIDLSSLSIPSLKIYAEHDGLASTYEVLENQHLLPKGAELYCLKGGNHSQFGYLGNLLGDDNATISLENQQELTLNAIVNFLTSIESQ